MYRFQVSIHALPPQCEPGPTIVLPGRQIATLAVLPEHLGAAMFDCTFEEVVLCLARLERLYVEPDGSFVWVSSQGDLPWQVDGMIYDHRERVRYIDVKGTCPSDRFDRLLAVLGWPQTKLIFQWLPAAVLLDESQFRSYAQWNAEQ